MKIEEDLGHDRDREVDFQTDDEENQAERVFEHSGNDTESEISDHSLSCDIDVVNTIWPQSYRYVFLLSHIVFFSFLFLFPFPCVNPIHHLRTFRIFNKNITC